MDSLSHEKRSWLMSRIKSTDTIPEMRVRSALHRAGYRFRLHMKSLPGKPDIVLPQYKIVIFVHGCFWHRHQNCSKATMPTTHVEFWRHKFADNVSRDKCVQNELKKRGWQVIVVWQCQLKNVDTFDQLFLLLSKQRKCENGKHIVADEGGSEK